jgi:hypothetical protein
MELIGESSLDEYARRFWQREGVKNDLGREALADIANGGDPVEWLKKHYDYKLPRRENDIVRIALLNQEEVEALLIHDYMVSDNWMKKRGLVPDPHTRHLKELAAISIARGYFAHEGNDTQHCKYRDWMSKGALKDVISSTERTLIECVGSGKYEIVDGWGRLLPFAALLQQGHVFHPVESFVASRRRNSLTHFGTGLSTVPLHRVPCFC